MVVEQEADKRFLGKSNHGHFFKTLFIKLQLHLKIFLEKGSSKLLEQILNFGPFWSCDR